MPDPVPLALFATSRDSSSSEDIEMSTSDDDTAVPTYHPVRTPITPPQGAGLLSSHFTGAKSSQAVSLRDDPFEEYIDPETGFRVLRTEGLSVIVVEQIVDANRMHQQYNVLTLAHQLRSHPLDLIAVVYPFDVQPRGKHEAALGELGIRLVRGNLTNPRQRAVEYLGYFKQMHANGLAHLQRFFDNEDVSPT